jgi:hypothetical protein
MLIIPRDEHYRKVLGKLESKVAMNLKCGACSSCSGGGNGCSKTGVIKVTT